MWCKELGFRVQGVWENRWQGLSRGKWASELSPAEGHGSREVMLIPVLAARPFKLAESLVQAGSVPVAGTK